MRGRVAWAAAILTGLFVVVDVVFAAQAISLTSETAVAIHGFPFVHGAVIGSALMGALIVSRYERHPIGWLLTFTGLAAGLSLLCEAYAYWAQESDGPGPDGLAGVAAWTAQLLGGQVVIAALALMFLLAPDGRLLSPRWRSVVWAVVAGAVLCCAAVLTMDPLTYRLVGADGRYGPVRAAMLLVGFLAISAGMIISVVSVVLRLRGSTGEERQQLRLIALAAALPSAGLVWMLVAQALNGGRQTWLSAVPLSISYLMLPILFAVAVLRHRLYELDVIINRTAVVLAATVFAAVGYTTLVVGVSSLVDRRTGGVGLSLVATALVAVAFQPVRRHVVRAGNRLAYGSRAQPYEELAEFSSRLVETPTVERLLPAVAAAAGQALAARSATARLGDRSASWGDPPGGSTDSYQVEVSDAGAIEVALPRGRGLRPSDERLLRALADQAAVAFDNVALEERLAAHVQALDRTTADLSRSRARIVEADDAARRDIETAISREVLPHLVAVTDGLARDEPVGPLVEEVNAGLEALREITRGVFPMQLARSGVQAALHSFPLVVGPELEGRRFPARTEAAIYFACTQTGATSATLCASADELELVLTGVAAVPQQVVDRVEASGGSLRDSDGHVSVLLPDLQQPVGVERGLGDVRRGAGP